MRMRHIEMWTEKDMAPQLQKELSKSQLLDIEWFRITEATVVCHAISMIGHARIGSCTFQDAKDFDPVVACKLSLFDAQCRGGGYDAKSERGPEPAMEAV